MPDSDSSTAPGGPARAPAVGLRPTTPADLDFVLAAEQHPDNRPFILPWSRERHITALGDSDMAHRIVERATDGKPIGFFMLAGRSNLHRSIEFRRAVVTAKGEGYGRSTVHAIKRLAFTELNAHRLWLDVMENNARARRLYQSEGFVVEGVLRECLRTDSRYQSLVVMSILAPEYQGGTLP